MTKFQKFVSNLQALSQIETALQNAAALGAAHESFVLSGAVSKFSMQTELGWKMLAELLAEQEGVAAEFLRGPRAVIKEAQAAYGDDFDGDLWIAILKARNQVVHMYDEDLVRELVLEIRDRFIPAFQQLQSFAEARYSAAVLQPGAH